MKPDYRFRNGSRMVFLVVFFLLLCPVNGFALDNQLWSAGLTFHFTPPGARALGMGGAFVALADDATAAVANPAGLAQLTRTQVAVEGRATTSYDVNKSFSFTSPETGSGSFSKTSTICDIEDVAFAAFTTPLFNNFINLSIFYNRPMDFVSSAGANLNLTTFGEYLHFHNGVDFKVDEPGLSLAKSFWGGKVMVGGSLGLQFLQFDRQTIQHLSYTGGSYSEFDFNNNRKVGVSGRGGVLAKPIDNLRIGVSASINPKFDTPVTSSATISGVTTRFQTPEGFKVPDNYSFGAAYNVFPNWVFIFEARYVLYSQLTKGFQITGYSIESPTLSQFSNPDIWELHFGTEYVLGTFHSVPIALRTGLWYEPARDLKYDGPGPIESNLFTGGKDLVHYTLGTGAVFKNHYQIDAGADITEEAKIVSVSLVYQF